MKDGLKQGLLAPSEQLKFCPEEVWSSEFCPLKQSVNLALITFSEKRHFVLSALVMQCKMEI